MDRYVKFTNNAFFLFLGNFGSKFISFFMVKYYTSVFSRSEYGIIDVLVTTAGFLIPLFSLDIHESVFRFCLDENLDKNHIINNGFLIAFLGNILLLFSILIVPFRSEIANYRLLLVLFCFTDCIHLLLTSICRGSDRVSLLAFCGIAQAVIQVILSFVFISSMKMGLKGYFYSFAISSAITSSLIWYYYLAKNEYHFGFDFPLLKKMLKYSIPLILNTACWWIMSSMDRYIISFFLGSDANGIYAAASKIPAIITTISAVGFQAWQISSVLEKDSQNKGTFFSEMHDFVFVIILLFSCIVMLLVKPIYKIYVGEDFSVAWKYTPFLIIAMNFSCLASFHGTNYVSSKDTKKALYSSLLAAIINLSLNILLTKRFGISGTTVATMISYLALWIVRCVDSKKYVVINTDYTKIFLSYSVLLIQGVISVYWESHIVSCGIICVLVLFVINLKSEKEIFRRIRHIIDNTLRKK